jgi:hypothetical protein
LCCRFNSNLYLSHQELPYPILINLRLFIRKLYWCLLFLGSSVSLTNLKLRLLLELYGDDLFYWRKAIFVGWYYRKLLLVFHCCQPLLFQFYPMGTFHGTRQLNSCIHHDVAIKFQIYKHFDWLVKEVDLVASFSSPKCILVIQHNFDFKMEWLNLNFKYEIFDAFNLLGFVKNCCWISLPGVD